MKKLLPVILLVVNVNCFSQRDWNASWISAPDIQLNEHNVIHLRKTFNLETSPEKFLVDLSADNQYRLFVNGKYVCKGPGRSDLEHWYNQTVDLAPHLKSGKNVLAVEVVNFGPARGFSQLSHLTAFIMHGVSEVEKIVNTGGDQGWKSYNNTAYFEKEVQWRNKKDIASGLYATNPTDSIVGEKYPWGWQSPEFDDSSWKDAMWLDISSLRYNGISGIIYPDGWTMIKRPVKNRIEKKEDFPSVKKLEGLEKINSIKNFVIPSNQKISLLIDTKVLTLGYPELIVSKGKNSHVVVAYAETLFQSDRKSKGDRNNLDGKQMIGISDVYMPDGGENRLFRPNWFRSFRFIQVDIETGNEPLEIVDFYNQKSEYPIELNARFETDNPFLNNLMEPGWRTTFLCTQDMFVSDAYYEQMQYLGDSRIQAEATTYLSGNDDHMRQALKHGDWSRIPEGLTRACYPDGFNLVIPLYSLIWIDMVYDHMMWAGDKEFTSEFDLGIYNVLEWFNNKIQDNGLIGAIDWWPYVDWCPQWKNGAPPGGYEGNSSIFSLYYAYTLKNAARICRFIGKEHEAEIYEKRAETLNQVVNKLCFDADRGLYADTPDKNDFSMHANILAVLSGAVKGSGAKEIIIKINADESLSKIALFFYYYYFEALKMVGMGDEFQNQLGHWKDMLNNNLTTFTEVPLGWGQRSDCHPWSCSPNIHFYKTICGIQPEKEGFQEISIKPNPGELKSINATLQHPLGKIQVSLNFKGKKVSGSIVLPEKIEGNFYWNNSSVELMKGENSIKL